MVGRWDETRHPVHDRNLLELVRNFEASLVSRLETLNLSMEALDAISTTVAALRGDIEAFIAARQGPPSTVVELGFRIQALEIRLGHAIANAAEWQRQAEGASRGVWRFLSEIGPDLRNPLAAVLNLAEFLSGEDLPVEQRIIVADLVRVGEELFDLLNDALRLIRLEAGLLPLSIAPVDPAGPVEEACRAIRPLADDHDVAIAVESGSDGKVRVQADRIELSHSLTALLRFAVTSSRPDDRVRAGWTPDADYVLLWIRDTGHGFEAERLAGLFDPMAWRPDSSSGGTRLRLVLARRLVEAMQGTIHVDSAPGRGSTFTLRLRRSCQKAS